MREEVPCIITHEQIVQKRIIQKQASIRAKINKTIKLNIAVAISLTTHY